LGAGGVGYQMQKGFQVVVTASTWSLWKINTFFLPLGLFPHQKNSKDWDDLQVTKIFSLALTTNDSKNGLKE